MRPTVSVPEQHCAALVHGLPSAVQQRLGLPPPGPAQISPALQQGDVGIPLLAASCVTWMNETVPTPTDCARVRTVNRPSTSTFVFTGHVEPVVEHRSQRPFMSVCTSGSGVNRADVVQR
jgi:hypothetical protein